MSNKTQPPPVPPHRPQPLLLASDAPIDELPTAHGLTAVLYPPAPGVCSTCRNRADRLTRTGRLCVACTEAA